MTSAPTLRKLRVELSLDCPLRCIHCSANAAPANPVAMPAGMRHRLLREFAAMGGQEVTFTGGEPLVDPELASLLADAKRHGLATVVFTSGTVRTTAGPVAADPSRFVALAPVLNRVVFSVYSTIAATHDAITSTPGSLAMTRAAIQNAIAAGIRAELHFVPTALNYRDIPALIDHGTALGIGCIRVIRYVPQGRGLAHSDQLALNADQQRELRDVLLEAMARADIEVRVGSGFGHLLREAPPCTAALEELAVSATGRVHPCSGFSGYRGPGAIGSVRDASLADVWRDSPYLRSVREYLAARPSVVNGGPCAVGCLAQKAAAAGRLTDEVDDPGAAALSEPVPA